MFSIQNMLAHNLMPTARVAIHYHHVAEDSGNHSRCTYAENNGGSDLVIALVANAIATHFKTHFYCYH